MIEIIGWIIMAVMVSMIPLFFICVVISNIIESKRRKMKNKIVIKAVLDGHEECDGPCLEKDCLFNEKGECHMTTNFENLNLPDCNTGYHYIAEVNNE